MPPGYLAKNLIEAIRAGRLSEVIGALDDGADIEMPDMHGWRGLPLRTACFVGNLDVVRELLRQGANPNAATDDGPGAPLRLALRKGHHEIVELLRQQGASENGGIDPSISSAACPLVPGNVGLLSQATCKPDNIIEFTRYEIDLPLEDAEPPMPFGAQTNVLSMELMFLDDNALPPLTPPAKNGR